MFIAGSYMLYSSPPTSMGPMSSLEPLDRPTSSSGQLAPSDNRNNNNKFSMSSILEQHVVPKTAACHVVVSSPSSTRTSPRPLLPPANTFSRQLKFGVDRILAISDCPVKRACSPMSEMASLSSRSCSSCLVSRNCCTISCPFGPHIGSTLGPGGGHHPHHHNHPQSHPYASTFPTTIVSPQPIIPFGPYAVYSPLTSEMHHQHQESKGHQQQGPAARTIMQHQQGHHLHHHHHHPPPPHHHHHPHHNHHQGSSPGKRKRSWSRAVFSNLQRKGLEKRFQIQKYITKPDRRQLAATLGLTDAQVKVWFQNRRMKWRHSKEAKEAFAQQDQQKPKTDAATNKCNNSKSEEVTIEESESKVKKVEDGPVISAISVENLVANN